MNRTQYLETRAGQAWAWRNRQIRQVRLQLNTQLESKNSSSEQSRIAFQRKLKRQLVKIGRQRAFHAPVVLQMDFTPSLAANFPSIHSLAKHYLDLFQMPVPGSELRSSRILLADDRLVKLLICNCNFHGGRPGVGLRVSTLGDFGADLLLYKRILDNNFSDATPDRGRWIKSEAYRDVDAEFDSLSELKRDRADIEARYSPEMWQRLNLMQLRGLQEALLRQRQIHPEQLIALFERSELQGTPFHRINEHLRAALKDLQMRALGSLSLGSLPAKSGDTAKFAAELTKIVDELRAAHPLLFPLLTTLGITILHTPGKTSQGIDLDNLARKIIPVIHERLNPPATGFHGLADLERSGGDLMNDEIWKSLKRVPKYHVSRYQVLESPRSERDPEEGSIKLILHSGIEEGLGAWDEMHQTIREWESGL
jgi:hypothetical protein